MNKLQKIISVGVVGLAALVGGCEASQGICKPRWESLEQSTENSCGASPRTYTLTEQKAVRTYCPNLPTKTEIVKTIVSEYSCGIFRTRGLVSKGQLLIKQEEILPDGSKKVLRDDPFNIQITRTNPKINESTTYKVKTVLTETGFKTVYEK